MTIFLLVTAMFLLPVTHLYVISHVKAILLAESTKLKLMSNLPMDHRILSMLYTALNVV